MARHGGPAGRERPGRAGAPGDPFLRAAGQIAPRPTSVRLLDLGRRGAGVRNAARRGGGAGERGGDDPLPRRGPRRAPGTGPRARPTSPSCRPGSGRLSRRRSPTRRHTRACAPTSGLSTPRRHTCWRSAARWRRSATSIPPRPSTPMPAGRSGAKRPPEAGGPWRAIPQRGSTISMR